MSDSDDEFDDSTLWETELEIALLTKCDYGTIRSISKLRPIPATLRSKVWKICLDVQQDIDANQISKWEEIYDLPQQSKIREDCKMLSEKLHPDNAEQAMMIQSQLEAIITFYCKSNDESYEKDNGWMELLYPIMSLNLTKNENYNLFNSILKRYIPKDCVQNGSPYHLFRLLMLYHDPELCALLDTKKISPDSYAHIWFRSLFSASSSLEVTLHLWDMYFQLGDQFLIFFMSLILVFNMKDEIMGNANNIDKNELIKTIRNGPTSVNVEDLPDLNGLCQHYATKTPQSFRKEYKKPLFEGISLEKKAYSIYQALCLPVSVDELLQANQLGSGVRYFIIDCRPAEQYNKSHYATAFHLDANLMLENPVEFNQSVEALLAAQQQAIEAGSVAGGQHLCFMGVGVDEEDKYVNMVVSNFLQRKINFVSLAMGGYEELRRTIDDPEMIVGTEVQVTRAKFTEDWVKSINSNDSVINKISSVFKNKSSDIKDKFSNYLSNSMQSAATISNGASPSASKKQQENLIGNILSQTMTYSNKIWHQPSTLLGYAYTYDNEKHVSAADKGGKLYRNQGNLFAIDDGNDDDQASDKSGNENEPEAINLKTWLEKPDTLKSFKCFYKDKRVTERPEWVPGYLLLTKTNLFGLTQRSYLKNGMVEITVRHPLNSIIKIATKSTSPELLSFTYGDKVIVKSSTTTPKQQQDDDSCSNNEEKSKESDTGNDESGMSSAVTSKADYVVKGKDWFYVPQYAGEAASAVKMQILEIMDLISK